MLAVMLLIIMMLSGPACVDTGGIHGVMAFIAPDPRSLTPDPRSLMPNSRPPTPDPRPLMAQSPPDPQAVEQGKNMRVALFLIIAIITSSLSLGIAFGIRRRIDQIGGLDEEDK